MESAQYSNSEQAHDLLQARGKFGVRGKVGAILLIALVLIMTAHYVLALHVLEQDVQDESTHRNQVTTHFIAQYLAYSVVSYDYHTLELILQELARSHDVLHARVENNRGNIMANVGSAPSENNAYRPYTSDIKLNGEHLGKLRLVFSSERTASVLAERRRDLLAGQLISVALLMLVGYLTLSMIVLKPLSQFTRVIRRNLQTSDGQLEPVAIQSQDEFGDLARGFNALQASLETTQQKLESRIDYANRELQAAYNRLEEQAKALRDHNRDLEHLTITDTLTGLYNRRHFEKLMENEVAQAIRNDDTLSILLVDVDHLKEINDRYGHAAGDTLLRSVAQMIGGRIRMTDVACRYSGDEFFVLCRRATIANAVAMADDMLRAMLEQPVKIDGINVPVSLSIGVATIPGVTRVSSAQDFFRQADDALRFCKQNGRNGVVHFSMLDRMARTAIVG